MKDVPQRSVVRWIHILMSAATELQDDEAVVRHVCIECIDDPIAVAPGIANSAVAFESAGFAMAGEIEPVAAPSLAVTRFGEQSVDELRVGFGGRGRTRRR